MFSNAEEVRNYAMKFLQGHWTFLGPVRIGLRKRLKDKSDAPAETPAAWPKNIFKFKETDKATFFSLTNERSLPAPSVIKPEERKFVVDSGSGRSLTRKTLRRLRIFLRVDQ